MLLCYLSDPAAQLNSAVPMTLIHSKYWSLAFTPVNMRCYTTHAYRRNFYYTDVLELLGDCPCLAIRLETTALRKDRHHPREVVCALGLASFKSSSTHLGSSLSRSPPKYFFFLEYSYKAIINTEGDMTRMRASDL